jgi:uncharacterized protein YbjT (DUF2867 family)
MKALVIGATGATGADLVDLLIKDPRFSQIDIFVRNKPSVQSEKLNIHIVDFDNPNSWKHLVVGDVAFSCMGTTIKDAGSKQNQWKIDYTYQFEFAEMAKENHVSSFVLVSSGMASIDSKFFYTKMKGQLEEDVKKLNLKSLFIFQPPVLIRKGSLRSNERLGVKLVKFLNILGIMKKQKPMPTEILAKTMIKALYEFDQGSHVLNAMNIWKLYSI